MHTALLTGGSRGIGLAIKDQLRKDGYWVLAPTRSELDLSIPESIDFYLSNLQGEIDILVNDAGINHIALLENIQRTQLETTMQVNLIAPFRIIQAIAPKMCKNKFGRIVNISSIWSMVSRPGRTSYTMSKTALNGMTRSMAVELAPYNVLINAVAPGFVLTDLTKQNNSKDEIENLSQLIPTGRLADPEEIANLVSFLCSERNSYLTGQTIVIDGGYSCL